MTKGIVYKRVLLKISGESLKGKQEHGYSAEAVDAVVSRIAEAAEKGVQIHLARHARAA